MGEGLSGKPRGFAPTPSPTEQNSAAAGLDFRVSAHISRDCSTLLNEILILSRQCSRPMMKIQARQSGIAKTGSPVLELVPFRLVLFDRFFDVVAIARRFFCSFFCDRLLRNARRREFPLTLKFFRACISTTACGTVVV